MIYEVTIAEKVFRVDLQRTEDGWSCRLDGREVPIDVSEGRNGVLSLLLAGKSYEVKQEHTGRESRIVVGQERFSAAVSDPRSLRSRRPTGAAAQGMRTIKAPMPGKVVRLLASEGSTVEMGQSVIVIEAMKMQNELKAPKNGIVKRIRVAEGAAVEAGQTLADVE